MYIFSHIKKPTYAAHVVADEPKMTNQLLFAYEATTAEEAKKEIMDKFSRCWPEFKNARMHEKQPMTFEEYEKEQAATDALNWTLNS